MILAMELEPIVIDDLCTICIQSVDGLHLLVETRYQNDIESHFEKLTRPKTACRKVVSKL